MINSEYIIHIWTWQLQYKHLIYNLNQANGIWVCVMHVYISDVVIIHLV